MGVCNRIYVIDPDSRRRAQLARMSYDSGIHAEPCQDIEEFLSLVRHDGHVLCIDQPGGSSIKDFMEATKAVEYNLPASVYAENPTPQQIVDAMLGGALSYHVWPMDEEALKKAITMTPEQVTLTNLRSKQAEAQAAIVALSPRELEVLEQVTKGHSNKKIAINLGISPRTVEIHRANMLEKLGLKTSSDAIRVGIYAGLDAD